MRFLSAVSTFLVIAAPLGLWGAEGGTPAEAKSMLKKAVAHYVGVGRKQALADFTAGKSPFRDRDLYVVCISFDHRVSASGGFPEYVGMTSDVLKDASSRPLGRVIIDSVSAKKEGMVSYLMTNPLTGDTEPKVLFVEKLSDDVCGVGAYSPS
ncbi:MAG TPA: cache domain-containing protein [Nitrospiraceae bacterium]